MSPPRGCRAPEEYAAPVSDPGRIARDVLHVTEGLVTVLTLHRPNAKNACNRALFASVREELDRAAGDAETSLLPALVGAQEAAALLLTGGWMGAQQAQRSSLAWKVTSGPALLEYGSLLVSLSAGQTTRKGDQ
jgi:enoyl-CoA hydratase/carnithine racemase